MATVAQNLQTAIENIAERLASLTGYDHPTISIDGVSYSTNEYRSGLIKDLEELQRAQRLASGPWEVRHRAYV